MKNLAVVLIFLLFFSDVFCSSQETSQNISSAVDNIRQIQDRMFEEMHISEDCIYVTNPNNPYYGENEYNIVFIGDSYPSIEGFEQDVLSHIDFGGEFGGIMSVEPMKSNQDLFKFYLIKNIYDFGLSEGTYSTSEIINAATFCPNDLIIVLSHGTEPIKLAGENVRNYGVAYPTTTPFLISVGGVDYNKNPVLSEGTYNSSAVSVLVPPRGIASLSKKIYSGYKYERITKNFKSLGGKISEDIKDVIQNAESKGGPVVTLHEFGHAFVNLGDEYESRGGVGQYPRLNCDDTRGCPKWCYSVSYNLLGTPAASDCFEGVSCWKGCFGDDYYRPTYDSCIMNNHRKSKDFCPVCKDGLLKGIDNLRAYGSAYGQTEFDRLSEGSIKVTLGEEPVFFTLSLNQSVMLEPLNEIYIVTEIKWVEKTVKIGPKITGMISMPLVLRENDTVERENIFMTLTSMDRENSLVEFKIELKNN